MSLGCRMRRFRSLSARGGDCRCVTVRLTFSSMKELPTKVLTAAACIVLMGLIGGCAAETTDKGTCHAAFNSLAPVKRVDGLEMVISDDFAATLEQCDSIEHWIDQLTRNPEVLSVNAIDREQALDYLAAACQLLANQSLSTSICAEAESEGLFSPM